MKRVFALFVTFMLSVTLIGCSNNKEKNYVSAVVYVHNNEINQEPNE